MKRWLLAAIIITAFAFLLSFGAAVLIRRSIDRPVVILQESDVSDLQDPIPDFALTNQDGEPVTAEIFDGRVTVLDFMFTNCPLVCPGLTAMMASVSGQLDGTGVRLVSISVDPAHDTPERLREYAAQFNADTARWSFLTGGMEHVTRILAALKFALREDTQTITLGDGSSMQNILHPTRILLIGPDRRVLGMYDYMNPDDIQRLIKKAREADAALR